MRKSFEGFKVKIWDFIDIEQLNCVLDDLLEISGITDIDYECVDIDAEGNITMNATFEVEENEAD